MAWNSAELTDCGLKLLSGMLNGGKLTITKALVGSGTVNTEELRKQTELTAPINATVSVAGAKEIPGKNGRTILVQIINSSVTETVRMRQVGIFAKTDSAEEVLLAIMQDDIGEEIPPYAEFPDFLIEFNFVLVISRTNNITVMTDSSAVVTRAEFEALKQEMSELDTSVISSLNIAIPISGWEANTDTGGIFIDIPAEGVTEDIIPIISIAPGDGAAAAKCGLSDRAETGNGFIRLFAKAAPEWEINADVILLSPSKKISSGGENITKLLPATATRLGGVKIGSGVSVTDDGVISVATDGITATDEDTENIIDEIFGPQSN